MNNNENGHTLYILSPKLFKNGMFYYKIMTGFDIINYHQEEVMKPSIAPWVHQIIIKYTKMRSHTLYGVSVRNKL